MSFKRINNKGLSVFKLSITIATLTLSFNYQSQNNVLFETPDTLNNQHHISGSIDSVDAFTPYLMSSFPSAQSNSLFLKPTQLFYEGGSKAFIRSQTFKKTYSSLPHLGFAYTFGMQGFQSTKVNYTQAFQNNLIININILRSQATGLLRNSSWKNQYMSTKLYKTGKKVSSFLSLDFSTVTAENNGGVLNISDINTYTHDIMSDENRHIAKSASIYGTTQTVNDYDIIPVLNSLAQIENFKQKLHNKPAAMQLDVGMKRLGINSYEILKAKELCRSINLKLILGHLSSADDRSDPANIQQLKQFLKLSKYFLNVPKSLSATGGTLLGKRYHFNLTRPGIGIFGGKPLKNAANVVSIELPVLQVKDIKKNEGVGYNHTFVSPTQKKIAIVGSGYADGLSRQLSNRGFLYAGSVKCPIIGRVSMDLITVDISKLPKAPINLSVLGPLQTIDDLAEQSRTIGYEVLTSLGSRYKRVYHY